MRSRRRRPASPDASSRARVGLQRRPQLVDPRRPGWPRWPRSAGADARARLAAAPGPGRAGRQGQHLLEVATGGVGPRPIRLVDDEDVGDLHQARLVGLHGVAPARVDHHHGEVGLAGHLHLHLADAHRLDQDQVVADRGQQAGRLRGGHGQAAQVAPGGHRADEDVVVEGVVAHAHPVAQDGAAGERRRRVDGQHGHPPPVGAGLDGSGRSPASTCRHRASRSVRRSGPAAPMPNTRRSTAAAGSPPCSTRVSRRASGRPVVPARLVQQRLGVRRSSTGHRRNTSRQVAPWRDDAHDETARGVSLTEPARLRVSLTDGARLTGPSPMASASSPTLITSVTPGTRSLRMRSMPALRVTVEAGQDTQAPISSTLTTPVASSTPRRKMSPLSAWMAGRMASMVCSTWACMVRDAPGGRRAAFGLGR